MEMTPVEANIAQTLAVMRHTVCRVNDVPDKQMGEQDPIQIDRDGVLAEMAFGKAFNLYPDFSIYPRKGGADLIGRNGKKIDVKATRYKTGRLLIHIEKEVTEVDIYVLAIVDGNTVDLVGYITAQDAMKEENIGDLGRGRGYVIERDQLKLFKEQA